MNRFQLIPCVALWGVLTCACFSSLLAEEQLTLKPFPGPTADWHGFEKHQLEVDGKVLTVVAPKESAAGRPWVWHGEFFGHKPAPDIELLKRGFHLVYLAIPNMLGSPPAVEHWNRCYEVLTKEYQFAPKAALVGLSRGGLYCYNWAIANPDKVACIYGDAPVCDFKSWPGGKGTGPGNAANWNFVLELWKFANDVEALTYPGNPVDQLKPLAEAGVPLLHVFGDADEVVPWEENTGLVASRYRDLGGSIQLIRKPGVGHHPHGLDDSTPIVEFVVKHATPPQVTTLFETGGTKTFQITSRYQSQPTKIFVLTPEPMPKERRLPILFLLPVEANDGQRWGSPLAEAVKHDLANQHQMFIVSPTFSELPWYADHPENSRLQQESYFMNDVLNVLRWNVPAGRHDRDGRLLCGFSKSGWGAWSLILRNPDTFACAAAWDAPLMMNAPGKYGSGPIFGTTENFAQYELSTLLEQWKPEEFAAHRLVLAGYDHFRAETVAMHELLTLLKVPVIYLDGPQRKHHWESGWLPEVIEALMKDDQPTQPPRN